MRKPVVLITGASGEIGHGLIERLAEDASRGIVTLDLAPLDPALGKKVQREVVGSILDQPVPTAPQVPAAPAMPSEPAEPAAQSAPVAD